MSDGFWVCWFGDVWQRADDAAHARRLTEYMPEARVHAIPGAPLQGASTTDQQEKT